MSLAMSPRTLLSVSGLTFEVISASPSIMGWKRVNELFSLGVLLKDFLNLLEVLFGLNKSHLRILAQLDQ